MSPAINNAMHVVPESTICNLLRDTLLGRVSDDLRHNYQTSEDMTTFLVLGMATFACQDGAYVRMSDGSLIPLTGYFVVSAPPGSGKSTLMSRLLKPFRDVEAEAAEDSAQEYRRYRSAQFIWKGRVRQLRRELDEAIAAGKGPDTVSVKLDHVLSEEPRLLLTASWIAEDTTIQALRHRLHKVWPSACIVLDEGIRFFNNPLSRAFADFCTLYDARLARNERVTTGVESVESAFLSMVIATQPGPLYGYLNEHGKKALGTGFLSRLQLLDVHQVMPVRLRTGRAMRHEALGQYDERVVLLKRDARKRMRKSGAFEPVIIDISEAAGHVLEGTSELIQARLSGNGYSAEMEAYLGRLTVLIARLAGVLHRFEGCEGPVAENTMRIAMEIGFWLALGTSKVLARMREPSDADKADIDALVQMLRGHAFQRRRLFIRKGELSAMAPSFGIDDVRCKRALQRLFAARWAWMEEAHGNSKIIRLSPHFFSIGR